MDRGRLRSCDARSAVERAADCMIQHSHRQLLFSQGRWFVHPRFRSLVAVIAASSTLVGVAGWRAATRSRSRPAPPDLAAIRAIVEAPITSGKVAGASVVVARQVRPSCPRASARRTSSSTSRCRPMRAEIGSVTKQFTAAAILLLVERGKLALDDELTSLPNGLSDERSAHHHPPSAHAHVRDQGLHRASRVRGSDAPCGNRRTRSSSCSPASRWTSRRASNCVYNNSAHSCSA